MERRAYRSTSSKGYNTDGSPDRAQLDLLCSPHQPDFFVACSKSPTESRSVNVDSGYNSPTLAAATVGREMSLPLIRRALPKGGRKPHVCIVGAGVSGLRCADVLLQAGLKVTVLEARNRIGGRLCQATTQTGHLVDLGPNWIHGTENNPILDLALETGTITHNWDGRQCIYDPRGTALSEEEATEASETIWSIIGDGMEYSKQASASIPANKSLLDYIKEKTAKLYTHEDNLHSKHLDDKAKQEKRDLLLKIVEMWGAFVGSPIERQSLRFLWLEECIDGENLFVAETYRKVLDRISRPALEGADIQFGRRVKTIETVADEDGSEDGAVKVHLADGSSALFDEVVMTAPLGWLKRNKDSAFAPPLPDRLSKAIDNLGYGCLDKFYISFPTAFWDTASASTAATTSTNPSTSARNTVPNTTATTAPVHQAANDDESAKQKHHPGFTQWTAPLYARATNAAGWNQECVNMAALPDGTAHPTLLFYTFGPTSQHLAAILAREEGEKPANGSDRGASSSSSSSSSSPPHHSPSPKATQELLRFFAPYYTRLPGYDAANPAHQPCGILATAWTNDELAGYGSYCNFQVGLEEGDADVEVLRKGVKERRVWFAGEHTASFLALGTVTGAYWSGEGVGREISWAYGFDGGKGNAE